MADVVGQNDEGLRRVEQSPGTEQLAGELRLEERRAGAPRSVQDQHRVARAPLGIALQGAERAVMDADGIESFTRRERHVGERRVAFRHDRLCRGRRR